MPGRGLQHRGETWDWGIAESELMTSAIVAVLRHLKGKSARGSGPKLTCTLLLQHGNGQLVCDCLRTLHSFNVSCQAKDAAVRFLNVILVGCISMQNVYLGSLKLSPAFPAVAG